MEELIKMINEFWYITPDPRCRGEHPEWDRYTDELAELFKERSEKEIREALDGLSDSELIPLQGTFSLTMEDKPFLEEYYRC